MEVWEPPPEPAGEALPWVLWTREPAATLPEGREAVRQDTCRWPSEAYHLTLKSGCRIEALRWPRWDRVDKAVVRSTSVAAQIVALRDRAQQEPDAPATALLREDECAVLVAKLGTGSTMLPLTFGQDVLWIGRLGGHLHRRMDGMPGVRTLWRGLRDLTLLVEGWRVARRLENRCGLWSGYSPGAASSAVYRTWCLCFVLFFYQERVFSYRCIIVSGVCSIHHENVVSNFIIDKLLTIYDLLTIFYYNSIWE